MTSLNVNLCNFIETFSNYIHVYTVLADANTDMGKMISNLVTEGLSYLDTRSDFWRQQKPMYARRHERLKQRRRPDVSSSKLSPNDYIIKELERIDQGKQEDKIIIQVGENKHVHGFTEYLLTFSV